MNKLLLTFSMLVLALNGFSQIDWGIRGGLNLANQNVRVEAFGLKVDRSGKAIPSFHAGAFVDFPISHNISIRPELSLTGKGTNFDQDDDNGDSYQLKIRPYYIELPVTVLYTRETRNQLRFFGGLGPALAYGIAGKISSDGESEDVFQDEGFKRLDLGLHVTAGIELPSRLFFSVNYTHGLSNIVDVEDSEGDFRWSNRVFGLSVGYFLKRR